MTERGAQKGKELDAHHKTACFAASALAVQALQQGVHETLQHTHKNKNRAHTVGRRTILMERGA